MVRAVDDDKIILFINSFAFEKSAPRLLIGLKLGREIHAIRFNLFLIVIFPF